MNLFAVLSSVLLAFAPGALIAFTLAGSATPFSTRLGLALALSAFVVGVQMLALTTIGLGFGVAAGVVIVLNAPAALLIWRHRPRPLSPARWVPSALGFAVLAAGIAVLWLIAPRLRIYSWHNMMQAEAVYQVTGLPRLPEEMGLAGVRLNYAWFGHIQIAAVGRLADASPFSVFPWFNLAALLAFFLIMLDAVRWFVRDRPVLTAALTLAALLSPNLVGVVLQYLGALGGAGDIRLSTPLHKFLHFDLMTNGLALFAGVLVLAMTGLDRRSTGLRAILLSCMTALALIYPLLLPAGLVVATAALLPPVVIEWRRGNGLRISPSLLLDAAVLIIPMAVGAVYLHLLSEGIASVPVAILEPWQMRWRLREGALRVGGVWLPFLAFAVWRAWHTRDPQRLTLLISGAVLATIFIIVELRQVHYKFLVAALLCVLPLVVEQAAVWLERFGRAAPAAATAIAAVVLVAVAPHIVGRHVPWYLLRRAEPIAEAGFSVTARASQLAWTDAIRERAPADTIVVHPPIAAPVEVLTQRSNYAALASVDAERPGYARLTIKGYSGALLGHRAAIVAAIYARPPGADYVAVDAALASFQRPVVLYLPRGSHYLGTLEAAHRGRALYADRDAVIWLIEPVAQALHPQQASGLRGYRAAGAP
jgi:hypothetical protein